MLTQIGLCLPSVWGDHYNKHGECQIITELPETARARYAAKAEEINVPGTGDDDVRRCGQLISNVFSHYVKSMICILREKGLLKVNNLYNSLIAGK